MRVKRAVSSGLGLRASSRLELGQHLHITPQLIGALHLLSLPREELERVVYEELLSNPLLDEVEHPQARDRVAGRESREPQHPEPWRVPVQAPYDSPDGDLRIFLRWQLLHLSGWQARAVDLLIDSLDENGFLTEPLDLLATRAGLPVDLLRRGLRLLQECDPPGIGARNAQECLRLQIARRIREATALPPEQREVEIAVWELADRIVRDHLFRMRNLDAVALARAASCSIEQAREVLRRLATLAPRPGCIGTRGLAASQWGPPDVEVITDTGGLRLVFRDEGLAGRIGINAAYARMLKDVNVNLSAEERTYLRRCLVRARWLLRALEHRRLTFRRIVEYLVTAQEPFFHGGPRFLRPITMSAIADALDLAPSTVSRALRGRRLACRWGHIPVAALCDAGSGPIKARLVELLATEDPRAPLSDAVLVERLAAEGVHVSRRAVTKYRSELGIPPARQRFSPVRMRSWEVLS